LIDAHRFDLYDEPMAELGKLEVYAHETSSALITLAAQILTGSKLESCQACRCRADSSTGIQQSFPLYAGRKQLFVPADCSRVTVSSLTTFLPGVRPPA
jgi:phytoene synthase